MKIPTFNSVVTGNEIKFLNLTPDPPPAPKNTSSQIAAPTVDNAADAQALVAQLKALQRGTSSV